MTEQVEIKGKRALARVFGQPFPKQECCPKTLRSASWEKRGATAGSIHSATLRTGCIVFLQGERRREEKRREEKRREEKRREEKRREEKRREEKRREEKRREERFLSAQADRFARAKREEKVGLLRSE
jgi:hypothetical protein